VSAALSPILPRIRAAVADAVLRGGKLVLTRASQVPTVLFEEARAAGRSARRTHHPGQ